VAYEGTHDGPLFGRPATHKSVDMINLIDLRFAEDGRIIEQIEMVDWPTPKEQLAMTDLSGTTSNSPADGDAAAPTGTSRGRWRVVRIDRGPARGAGLRLPQNNYM
jgi:hypothetical protein